METLTFVRQPFYSLLKKEKSGDKKIEDEMDRMLDTQIEDEKN